MILRQFPTGSADYAEALRLRTDVLRTPLGLALTPDDLARDKVSFHLGGFERARLLAVLLLQPLTEREIQMRQVAVRPELQKTGIGAQLIAFAEIFAREKGYREIVAHARGTALGFYLRLGYTAVGAEFLEQTIPHRLVTKSL